MALYPSAIKRPIPPGPNDPPIKPRVVILHIADSEATSLYPYFNGPSGGVESHFYVRYDGTVEQYRDTSIQADANVMANDFAISIETQGKAAGQWTPQQMATIKALLAWCHATHGIPLVVCPRWDGAGIGYHVLFEDQWDQRHASCPGPGRIAQFKNELVPWMTGPSSPASPIPHLPKPNPKPAPSKGLNVKLIDLRDVSPYVTGPGVKPLQRLLGVPADGYGGPGTKAALGAAQRRCGLRVDYIFGPNTAEALLSGK